MSQIQANDPDLYTEALALVAIDQKQKRGKCYNCKRTGHYARDCPEHGSRNRSGHQQPHTGLAKYPIIPDNRPHGDYNPRMKSLEVWSQRVRSPIKMTHPALSSNNHFSLAIKESHQRPSNPVRSKQTIRYQSATQPRVGNFSG